MLVCDRGGEPAVTTVKITVDGRNVALDLCARHLRELLEGSHAPKRGRRPGSIAAKATTVRQRRKPTAKNTAARQKTTRRGKTATRRRTASKKAT
jgi:hypothetical protein